MNFSETGDSIKIFDSIFDAFQYFAPCSPLLQLQNDTAYFFRRSNQYELIDMQDGYIGAFPGFPMILYRGEYKDYGFSKASIYRSDNPDDVIIDELRIVEFKNILSIFPQVQYAIEDHMRVDYLALAQHYGLNTNLIDVTSEPEIAAYFATHRWIDGIAVPVEEGIGCIHGIAKPILDFCQQTSGQMYDPKFHMIGLQCFQRPGIQAAYGIELDRDEDLRTRGWTIYFKQNAKASRLIHMNFHIDQMKVDRIRKKVSRETVISDDVVLSRDSWLFPQEDIVDVAECVRKSRCISRAAVEEYGVDKCIDSLNRNNIEVVDRPIYELTEEKRRKLAEEYKGRPYGNVQLNARLVYI